MSEGGVVAPQNPLARSSTLGWEISTIVLDSCDVQRGSGNPGLPAEVDTERDIQSIVLDYGIVYLVKTDTRFMDEKDEIIASVTVTFASLYSTGEDSPAPDAIEGFTPSVVMHVTPFIREFLSTMTNRLAIPQYSLPLVRRHDVDVRVAPTE